MADANYSAADAASKAAVKRFERRFMAVLTSVALHLVVLSCGAAATTMAAGAQKTAPVNLGPFVTLGVALVLAHCSGTGIWWARSAWSISAKTIAAVLCTGVLWLLLMKLLTWSARSGPSASAWGMCLVLQLSLTASAVVAIELLGNYKAAVRRIRFSIFFLLLVTTIVAAVLGVIGEWGRRHGWKIADVPGWKYFAHVQLLAVLGSVLAIGVYICLRVRQPWLLRILAGLCCSAALSLLGPVIFSTVFKTKVDASTSNLVWLFAGQGAFLMATLFPTAIANDDHIWK